jgi:DNA adenine methylase
VGGKRRLAKRLLPLFPPHSTYVEPFAGGAQVLFHKPPSKVEVLNDLDDDIVNFLRVCQRHPQELIRVLRWQPPSRRLFEWHQDQPSALLTDVERAAQFFYLQKNCWGGLRRPRRVFQYNVLKPNNYAPAALPKRLLEAAERLACVQIEHLPYEQILARYDRPTTFFYCDPPYIGVHLYRHNFSDPQFEQLAERLTQLKGRFLLSLNECPKARHWFGHFHSRPISVAYAVSRTATRVQELLFANYPLPEVLPTPLTPAHK